MLPRFAWNTVRRRPRASYEAGPNLGPAPPPPATLSPYRPIVRLAATSTALGWRRGRVILPVGPNLGPPPATLSPYRPIVRSSATSTALGWRRGRVFMPRGPTTGPATATLPPWKIAGLNRSDLARRRLLNGGRVLAPVNLSPISVPSVFPWKVAQCGLGLLAARGQPWRRGRVVLEGGPNLGAPRRGSRRGRSLGAVSVGTRARRSCRPRGRCGVCRRYRRSRSTRGSWPEAIGQDAAGTSVGTSGFRSSRGWDRRRSSTSRAGPSWSDERTSDAA